MKRSAAHHLNVIGAAHIACYCSPPCSRPSVALPGLSSIGQMKRIFVVIANAVKQSALAQPLGTIVNQFPKPPQFHGEVGIGGGGR